jgi:hypothetical protein
MALHVLSIGFLQNLMGLFEDVLNCLNESGVFFSLRLNMGRICLYGCNRYCNINGTEGLESEAQLKWDMADGAMESPVVTVLNIGETLIPCTWRLTIVHAYDVHNNTIDYLGLVFCWGVESSGFSELTVTTLVK